MKDREKQVREKAYQRFLARGGQHGNDQQDWFEAEQEVAGEGKSTQTAKGGKAPKAKRAPRKKK